MNQQRTVVLYVALFSRLQLPLAVEKVLKHNCYEMEIHVNEIKKLVRSAIHLALTSLRV